MMNMVQRFFSVSSMLRPEQIQGPLPSTKEAYSTNFHIAWPAALETVLVALIASVDIIMVGSIGPAAISAVGITAQPKFMILAVIVSLNIGVTAIVARRKGENDSAGANQCLKQCLILSSVLSFMMTILGFLFAKQIMVLAGAQPDFIQDAVTYFKIILIGNFFSSVGLTINAAQRGVGNTRISMRTNLTANCINLIFNYFLIGGNFGFPRLEVAGAAIATVLGNIVAFLMSIYSICHKNQFLTLKRRCSWHFSKATIGGVMKVGSSAMVEQIFMRIGFFTYAVIVAHLGTIAFAAHQIGMNVINISFAFGDGLGVATASLIGQSLGAKRPDLAILYGKVGQRIAQCAGVLLCIIFIVNRGLIVSLYSNDPEVIRLGAQVMIVIGLSCLVQTAQVVLTGCLRGAGDALYVALVAFVSISVFRPIISYLLCYPAGFGLIGAWYGLMFDQAIRFCFSYVRFASGKWTAIRL